MSELAYPLAALLAAVIGVLAGWYLRPIIKRNLSADAALKEQKFYRQQYLDVSEELKRLRAEVSRLKSEVSGLTGELAKQREAFHADNHEMRAAYERRIHDLHEYHAHELERMAQQHATDLAGLREQYRLAKDSADG